MQAGEKEGIRQGQGNCEKRARGAGVGVWREGKRVVVGEEMMIL